MIKIYLPLFLTAFVLILIISGYFPGAMPCSPAFIFYRHTIWKILSYDMLFYAFACGTAMLLLVNHSRKLKTWVTISILGLLALILNMNTFMPVNHAWSVRILYNSDQNSNPFIHKGFSNSRAISEYPAKHLEHVKKGYKSVFKEESRLTTYPPGLPVFYAVMNNAITSFPALTEALNKLALCENMLTPKYDSHPQLQRQYYALVAAAVLLCYASVVFSVIMAFIITRLLTGNTQNAVMAGAMTAFIPSLALFSDTPNIYFPGISLLIVYLCINAIKSGKLYLLMPSGIIAGLALFMTFEFNVTILVCAIPVMLFFFKEKTKRIQTLLWSLSGFITVAVIFYLCGYNHLEMFSTTMKNNQEFYKLFNRQYIYSFGWNIFEFFCFGGIICITAFFAEFPALIKDSRNIFRTFDLNKIFALSIGIVFMLLILTGSVRGELSRNCMGLMTFFPIALFSIRTFTEKTFYIYGFASILYLIVICTIIEVNWLFLAEI